jgi:hypothetical protein
MMLRWCLVLITIFCISCFDSGFSNSKKSSEQYSNNLSKIIQKERMDFLSHQFKYLFIGSPPTINTFPTRHYGNSFPKAAAIADYNKKPFECLMAVNFSWPFENNLPKMLLEELRKWNLLEKKAIDIFWVVQPMSSMGGNTIGNEHNISYLKAHGWADPNEPQQYVGRRVDREFLYGIYNADVDISYEVKLNQLKPFQLIVHDGMYSPETGAIKLPDDKSKSISFWSLVIDSKNPRGKIRALATLHWLISEQDMPKFLQETFEVGKIADSRGVTAKSKRLVRYKTIGKYIAFLKTNSIFKNTSLMKKLLSLLEDEVK